MFNFKTVKERACTIRTTPVLRLYRFSQ